RCPNVVAGFSLRDSGSHGQTAQAKACGYRSFLPVRDLGNRPFTPNVGLRPQPKGKIHIGHIFSRETDPTPAEERLFYRAKFISAYTTLSEDRKGGIMCTM
ncbi:MAG: hypothetical protein AB1696_29375, partial [Planctomycetota bacterium]